MVGGLELFKQHFSVYAGQYMLIGGTACDLAMGEAGQTFRATQDLDIVLCAEALTDEFIAAFWQFIREGQYQSREKSDGSKEFFRFRNPAIEGYPREIELFSRKPDMLTIPSDCTLTPIPASEDVSSLSAILLDEEYYSWIRQGDKEVDGIHIVGAEYLIPLKMKAWLDLSRRKAEGESIDSRKIRKHPNDVFRLFTILMIEPLVSVPLVVQQDVKKFMQKIESETIDFKNLGLGRLTMKDALDGLSTVYGIGG